MPMTLSPGSSSARNAAMLAFAPECGCTLACSAPNSAQARVAGELLGLVDHEVAAVVPLARVALGVLVREHRANGQIPGLAEISKATSQLSDPEPWGRHLVEQLGDRPATQP